MRIEIEAGPVMLLSDVVTNREVLKVDEYWVYLETIVTTGL